MRYLGLVVIIGCLTATGELFALTDREENEAAASQEPAAQQRNPAVKQGPRQPAKPAATFRPSERIGADSAVSFPVDI